MLALFLLCRVSKMWGVCICSLLCCVCVWEISFLFPPFMCYFAVILLFYFILLETFIHIKHKSIQSPFLCSSSSSYAIPFSFNCSISYIPPFFVQAKRTMIRIDVYDVRVCVLGIDIQHICCSYKLSFFVVSDRISTPSDLNETYTQSFIYFDWSLYRSLFHKMKMNSFDVLCCGIASRCTVYRDQVNI